ncbi:MAG TPA: hypothetical protein VM098_07290 [Phycisphaerae bacterium]|nr:hypothetical protein [Phycisphaerae bacterium]
MARNPMAKSERLLQPGAYDKLARLRMLLRARLAAEGLAWVVMALVAAVFVTLGFDRLLRLDDRVQRAVIVTASLAAVVYVVWRELLAPLLVPMGLESLALLVERRYRQLGDRLVSAIQFSLAPAAEGLSRAMIQRTAAEADAMAGPLDYREVVERRRLLQVAIISACALGLLAGFSVWQHDMMRLWFRRNVMFADVSWPQRTYLQVLDGHDFDVLRGEDLTIRVAVKQGSVAPPHITLHRLLPSIGRPTEEQIDQVGSSGRYVAVIRGVNESFEFYVTGGDDQTDKRTPHKVRVIDPPVLQQVVFTPKYPRYVTAPEALQQLKPSGAREVVTFPYGGSLDIQATANKEVISAEIYFEDKKIWSGEPVGRRELVVRSITLPCENQLVTRTLRFVLKDAFALEHPEAYSRREGQVFSVQIQPDDPPSVQVAKIGGLPDFYSVTPAAGIPLRVTIKDRYGVGLVELTERHKPLVAKAEKQLAMPPEKIRQQYRLPSAKVVVSDKGSVLASEPIEALLENKPQVSLDHTHKLSLQGRVKAGRTIRVLAEAEDGRTAEFGGPGVGRSKYLELEVVEPQVMADKLLARQKKAAENFAAAIQLQSTAYAKSAAAAESEALRRGSSTAELRAGLSGSSRSQRAVGDACRQAADVFQAILEESQYNGIGGANEYVALGQGIVQPLRVLAWRCGGVADELGGIVSAIERSSNDKDKGLPDTIAEAAAKQQTILEEMKTIARRMEKLRSLQAMADKLEGLIRWIEELQREIKQRRDAGLEGILKPQEQKP